VEGDKLRVLLPQPRCKLGAQLGLTGFQGPRYDRSHFFLGVHARAYCLLIVYIYIYIYIYKKKTSSQSQSINQKSSRSINQKSIDQEEAATSTGTQSMHNQ
jgi:hypothetical protein